MGVFSSWDTLETNSWREASSWFILARTSLKASAMWRVSRYSGALTRLVVKPALTAAMDLESLSRGLTR